jgi:NADH/F420H2 dehydrogenase subunit C
MSDEKLPNAGPPAPKPANPAAENTATISEVSAATGSPTKEADEVRRAGPVPPKPSPVGDAKPGPPPPPPRAAGAKPAAPAAEAHKPAAAAPAGPPDPPPPAGVEVPAYLVSLQQALPGAVQQLSYWVGDWTVIVPFDRLQDVARYLRDTPEAAFDLCADATASDWPARAQRFDVIYTLYSTRHRRRVRIKARASEADPVPSMTAVWPAANWLEREVYDLFGVNFVNHPDRRRILMPEDWQGFPQRKDYPLEGPGELLMESPLDWLKLRQAKDEADIE